ncbi:hypothetical protein [Pontibacillus marinus]|uniref:DUF4352 domain-containing protein n=1 Tax=Pontibacillus marinus BH030004 = DSM 16465 TaxID=1385511 RepID=A0A0A5GER3_9BACI|nr:hypothetical protein [Pontibacillus marinus]KGX89708.1 hypothetical protein N783_04920 [Pontibacillus marinus BH030004 = DSM 16465]
MRRMILLSILAISFSILVACSPQIQEAKGTVEKDGIQFDVEATYNKISGKFDVVAKVTNNTNQQLELIYSNRRIINYEGQPQKTEGVDVYSQSHGPGDVTTIERSIPKGDFLRGEEPFRIKIVYSLEKDNQKKEIEIPLHAEE